MHNIFNYFDSYNIFSSDMNFIYFYFILLNSYYELHSWWRVYRCTLPNSSPVLGMSFTGTGSSIPDLIFAVYPGPKYPEHVYPGTKYPKSIYPDRRNCEDEHCFDCVSFAGLRLAIVERAIICSDRGYEFSCSRFGTWVSKASVDWAVPFLSEEIQFQAMRSVLTLSVCKAMNWCWSPRSVVLSFRKIERSILQHSTPWRSWLQEHRLFRDSLQHGTTGRAGNPALLFNASILQLRSEVLPSCCWNFRGYWDFQNLPALLCGI